MTNREMVSGATKHSADVAPENAAAAVPRPNTTPLPAMPADEGSTTPTTHEEPVDSPQPNASVNREPPTAAKPGLATKR